MNLISPTTIKELLAKYQAKPSKGLGQNFLVDQNVLNKIVAVSNIQPDDIIIEVGPGLGTLTKELAQKAKQVFAVEKDETMIEVLKETLADFKNVQVINGDILKLDLSPYILKGEYKVVANIPYYLTSPLIRKFLESEKQPQEMVLMLQKEVAKRICSKPPQMSLLAVSVQFYAKAHIEANVSKNCFWPAPKVDSAIIKIIPTEKQYILPDLFFQVVKAGFVQPRKQLVNNLTTLNSPDGVKLTKEQISSWLLENKIKPSQRSETLNISDWVNLAKSFKN